ncbi:MAG: leucine-rich repeat protein [Erysipelotrichaceae bacterium]|nr:leucine-rich repeat protein [Erysipelotrichaceae bacterium]
MRKLSSVSLITLLILSFFLTGIRAEDPLPEETPVSEQEEGLSEDLSAVEETAPEETAGEADSLSSEERSGICGTDTIWSLSADGILTISGSGRIGDYTLNYFPAPWYDYAEDVRKIVVEEGVQGLGNSSFYGLYNVQEAVLPSGITEIPDYAFSGCSSLRIIILPEGLQKIGAQSFQGAGLETLSFPNGLQEIGAQAFSASGIKEVILPEGLQTLGSGAFHQCRSLSAVSIPSTLKVLNGNQFMECKALQTVYLPGTIETIGQYVFGFTDLKDIYYDGCALDWEKIDAKGSDIERAKLHFLSFDEGRWVWSEDLSSAELVFTCNKDASHVVRNPAKVTKETACEDGVYRYTAVVSYNGEEYTDIREVPASFKGHDYELTSFTWRPAYTGADAVFTCKNDPTHVVKKEAVIETETIPATCTETGKEIKTAKVELDGKEYTIKKEWTLYAKGHDYLFDHFEWSDDLKTAAVHAVCENDHSHVQDSQVTVSKKTTDTQTVFTASYNDSQGKHTEEKTVNDIVLVSDNVTYDQEFARRSLDYVNRFRTGPEAWYWSSDNKTKIQEDDLGALSYDYDLEKIAMQRAVEAAFSGEHDRLDEVSCHQTAADLGYDILFGENLAFGGDTPEEVVERLKEKDDNYSGQGHRRNMLNRRYTRYGSARIQTENNGVVFVQVFAWGENTSSYTEPFRKTVTGKARVNVNHVSWSAIWNTYDTELYIGETMDLSQKTLLQMGFLNGYFNSQEVSTSRTPLSWKADSGNITVKNNRLTAVSPGEARIAMIAPDGKTQLSLSLTVADKKIPTLRAVYNSANGADIRWKPLEGVEEYVIMKKTNGVWAEVTTVKASSLTKEGGNYKYIDGSIKGQEYYGKGYIYSVAVRDNNGYPVYDTLGLPLYRLNKPTFRFASKQSDSSVELSWNEEKCDGYEVQYSADNGKTWMKVPETKKSSITVEGLDLKKQNYVFRLRIQKTNKDRGTTWSQYSDWISPGESVSGKPTLTAIYNSANGADIRWKPMNGVDEYTIMKKTGGVWAEVTTVKVSSLVKDGGNYKYIDTTVKDDYGKGYIYSVAVRDSKGDPVYDTYGLPLYRLRAPTILTGVSPGPGDITLTWSKEECNLYEVEVSADGGKTWNITAKTPETKIEGTDAYASGKEYVFRMRCQKTNKSRGTTYSPWSAWKKVTTK